MICLSCPRKCASERGRGYCGAPKNPVIARAALHHFEEPLISGKNGSGTVFFSYCNMRCAYCQNFEVSRGQKGREVNISELADIFNALQAQGAHNINLVTPSHYTQAIKEALQQAALKIPVVYNTSGYDLPENLINLSPYVKIWLTDFKYARENSAELLSDCPDYPSFALTALETMLKLAGAPVIENGLLKSGVIIRHLVLPGYRKKSIEVLDLLKPYKEKILLSLMAQYTIMPQCRIAELRRKLTSFEYNSVAEHARNAGFEGFIQDISAAGKEYVPEF